MAAQIIDGKQISQNLREKLKGEIQSFYDKTSIKPGLAVILVGEDPASKVYVKNKINGCESVGIKSYVYNLPEETTQNQIRDLIEVLNQDKNIHGILVQLPLPKHLNESEILSCVDFCKDVDGFHCVNAGNLLIGNDALLPCTPSGCMHLINQVESNLEGKNAVVIGRSNIVGKPLAIMLLSQNATVTICHSKTKNLKEICKNADILCAAVGRPNFVTGDMIKPGAIVIDVGINRFEGKLVGDVNFDEATKAAGYITPVPGGVGPMTITMLLYNTLKAAKKFCVK